ncbi:MAG: hypothetical protein ACTHJ1_10525 [Bordetella sp.]|uniref:hypothetical protein n=1 Tax=Bordetella sp. TaxID=28081 RepID=UPI003F7C84F7
MGAFGCVVGVDIHNFRRLATWVFESVPLLALSYYGRGLHIYRPRVVFGDDADIRVRGNRQCLLAGLTLCRGYAGESDYELQDSPMYRRI